MKVLPYAVTDIDRTLRVEATSPQEAAEKFVHQHWLEAGYAVLVSTREDWEAGRITATFITALDTEEWKLGNDLAGLPVVYVPICIR